MIYKFTSTNAKDNFPKMDKKFMSILEKFLSQVGVIGIEINSSYRKNSTGSYHAIGMALDIHSITWKSGKIQYFTARANSYTTKEDDNFYNLYKKFFDGYKFEYISPSNIHTGYQKGPNKYRDYSRENKVKILDQAKRENWKYEINHNHLHHLHIAFNPLSKITNTIKTTAKNSGSGFILGSLIFGGAFLWRQHKK
jgi:hypothetical protein